MLISLIFRNDRMISRIKISRRPGTRRVGTGLRLLMSMLWMRSIPAYEDSK